MVLTSNDNTKPSPLESTPIALKSKTSQLNNYSLPIFDLSRATSSPEDQSEILSYFRAIGFMHKRLSQPNPPENPTTESVTIYSWKGLILCSFILECLNELRERLNHPDNTMPWAVLTVWGYEDSPVAWGESEHYVEFSGENDYTFIVFPGDMYICFVTFASKDEPVIKKIKS